jgi:hypothetical protein
VAVLRGGGMLSPRGPTRLHAGDQLVAVTGDEARSRLLTAAAAGPAPGAPPPSP